VFSSSPEANENLFSSESIYPYSQLERSGEVAIELL